MKTVAIIQARMGSSRLPGKVLQLIAGKPVLWHVVQRLRKCQEIDEIVIATTTNNTDDPIIEFAAHQGVTVMRGSENNVLDRFLQVARAHNADVILRVTGDAPLIDAQTIDNLLLELKRTNSDICDGKIKGPVTIHEGFTPLSRRALEALNTFGSDDPAVREHVTVKYQDYIPDLRVAYVGFKDEHVFKGARISVDTPADIIFLNTVYRELGAEPGEADIADVVTLLKNKPELLNINAHVHQKDVDEVSHEVIIRCDGGGKIGLGHVMRCLSLSLVLRDQYSVGVHFVLTEACTPQDTSAHDLIANNFFSIHTIPKNVGESDFINTLIATKKISGVIFDIRTSLSSDYLEDLKTRRISTICIDDPSDRRLACDLAFYPPVPQVQHMSWNGFEGTLHVGWEWVLLSQSFLHLNRVKHRMKKPRLLLSFGGSDPHGIIFKALEALAQVKQAFDAHIVMGHAFCDRDHVVLLAQELSLLVTIHSHVDDMASLMSTMDLAVVSFGVTAYELAAIGVPSLLICLNEEHAIAAQAFTDANLAQSLGIHTHVSSKALSIHIENLLQNDDARNMLHNANQSLNIINGTHNVASAIKQQLNKRHT